MYRPVLTAVITRTSVAAVSRPDSILPVPCRRVDSRSSGAQESPSKLSTVTERRYGAVGAFVAKVIRPSPAGLRRLVPRLIIGFRPVAPPNGFSREPCGNVPWSKPGITGCSSSVTASAMTAVTAARRSCPGFRAVSARVRASGVNQWLHPRINR